MKWVECWKRFGLAVILLTALLLVGCFMAPAKEAGLNDDAAGDIAPALPAPTLAATVAPTFTPEPSPEPTPQVVECSVRAVGDLMCCEYQIAGALLPDGGYDFNPSFSLVREELAGADLTIGNLETNYYPEKPIHGTMRGFNAPIEYIDAVKNCGFDVLVTANNHSFDMGIPGVLTTIEAVRAADMVAVGTNLVPEEARQLYVRDVNGLQLGILAYSTISNKMTTLREDPDAAWSFNFYTEERLAADVEALGAMGAEAILVYFHAGVEKDISPRRSQIELADYAYSLGIDIVLMSHTHSMQPFEKKTVTFEGREKTVFCAYGLGNFMSSALHDESLRNVILNLDLRYDRASGVLDIDASYLATYTINFYDENKARQFHIVPLEAAIADYENVVDSRTKTGLPALERERNTTIKRLGEDYARPIDSFLP